MTCCHEEGLDMLSGRGSWHVVVKKGLMTCCPKGVPDTLSGRRSWHFVAKSGLITCARKVFQACCQQGVSFMSSGAWSRHVVRKCFLTCRREHFSGMSSSRGFSKSKSIWRGFLRCRQDRTCLQVLLFLIEATSWHIKTWIRAKLIRDRLRHEQKTLPKWSFKFIQIQYWYVFLFFRDDYQLCLVGKQPVVYSMAHDAAFRSEIIFLWGSKRLLGPDAYVHVTHC